MTESIDSSFGALRQANQSVLFERAHNEARDVSLRALEVSSAFGAASELLREYALKKRGVHVTPAPFGIMIDEIADKLADTIILIDLLANDLGINLATGVPVKFNRDAENAKHTTRLKMQGTFTCDSCGKVLEEKEAIWGTHSSCCCTHCALPI